MKTKVIRIYWKDWLKMKRFLPPKKDETIADYIERIVEVLK